MVCSSVCYKVIKYNTFKIFVVMLIRFYIFCIWFAVLLMKDKFVIEYFYLWVFTEVRITGF